MSRIDPTSARADNLFFAGPRAVASMMRANQRSLQSIVNFYTQQAENARITATSFLSNAQPLAKSTNPAEFMQAWFETAEKCSDEALQRLRESVDECREECFKAAFEAADETAPAAEAAVKAVKEVGREAKATAKAA